MESIQELKFLLARIDERQNHMNQKIDGILEQTTKTNGRVSTIETHRLPKIENWQSKAHGIYLAIAGCAMVVAFIVGVIIDLKK
jgi:hypothetical protein